VQPHLSLPDRKVDETPTPEDDFWPVLEKRIHEQIQDIDRQVDVLYAERDRLQYFLNDHKGR
jgi:hypothetical protein